jgi:ABC-type dipeptide/oligopeptide/nickel transport system permease subunit
MVAMALFPDSFTSQAPNQINLRDDLVGPSEKYRFGTDYLGRDVFSRSVHGTQITFKVAISSVLLSAVFGTILGLLSGYYGGLTDQIVMAIVDAGMAIPTLFLALVIIAALGSGLNNLVLAIAISGLPRYIYLIRPQVRLLAHSDYAIAAECIGAPARRIMTHHILPNLASSLIVLTSTRIAQAVLVESSLNFLGLGVAPPTPTWGNMIAEGRTYLTSAPWYPLVPGVFIMITVLGFNLIGDGLRDILDPTVG